MSPSCFKRVSSNTISIRRKSLPQADLQRSPSAPSEVLAQSQPQSSCSCQKAAISPTPMQLGTWSICQLPAPAWQPDLSHTHGLAWPPWHVPTLAACLGAKNLPEHRGRVEIFSGGAVLRTGVTSTPDKDGIPSVLLLLLALVILNQLVAVELHSKNQRTATHP